MIDVAELVALQQGKFDDRELAVHGYLSPFLALPCPFPGELPVLVLRCPQDFRWLMQEPEILESTTSSGTTTRQPSGPALNPRLIETLGDEPIGSTSGPREVIAIGHLDDTRAELCPVDQRDECRRAFVIDRLIPAGAPIDLGVPEPTTSAASEIVASAASAADMPAQVLVLQAFEDRAALARIQPAIDLIRGSGPAWLVRLLGEDGVGRTFAVTTGGDIVYEFGRYGIKQITRPTIADQPAS